MLYHYNYTIIIIRYSFIMFMCLNCLQIPCDNDSSTHLHEEDNISVGTIYESIDNLVLQFDDAIRNMGKNIKPATKASVKPSKKKDHSIFRQHSFLSSRSKGNKSHLWSEKRAEFEKGESD